MTALKITYRIPSDLTANPCNARTHTPRQIRQIARSIRSFGFANPILVDEHDVLIAGHGRLAAAQELGLDQVPVIRLAHLSKTRKRGLMLADNRIAENAGWDADQLARELADLSAMELDFELDVTGFDFVEIDLAIEELGQGDTPEPPDCVPEPDPEAATISEPDDLWLLGPHRVICGNARSRGDMDRLMDGEVADAGFTDPPYNVPIRGHVSGKGGVQHREFAEAAGEMTSGQFRDFLAETLGQAAAMSRAGAVWFVCMDWRHVGELTAAGQGVFDRQLNLCVWAKTNGGMGSLYRSQHELVFVYVTAGASHRNNVQLGRYGRNRTNLWTYPGVNTFRPGRMDELRAHPTAKPVALVKDALLDVSRRGDIILDPFAGAGSTLIAAERCSRRARLLEIDPAYVDVILRRWREETGGDPVRSEDGISFAALEAMQGREGWSNGR